MAIKSRKFVGVVILLLTLLPRRSSFHKIGLDDVLGKELRARTRKSTTLSLVQVQVVFRTALRTAPVFCETDKTQWWQTLTDPHPTIALPSYRFRDPATGHFVNRAPNREPSEKTLPGGAHPYWLTKRGMEEAYNLGQTLRTRYVNEFSLDNNNFQENLMELYTSNYERARMSLAYVMAGVFPNNVKASSGKAPLSFNILDSLLTKNHIKDVVTWKRWKEFSDTYADKLIPGYQQKVNELATLCGEELPGKTWLLQALTDMMVAWKANHLDTDERQPAINPLTTGLLPMLPDLQLKEHKLYLAKFIGDSRFDINLKSLTAKPLLLKILSNMNSYIEGTGKKAIFFSGHDVTVISLMSAVGRIPETALPASASLTFELYHDRSTSVTVDSSSSSDDSGDEGSVDSSYYVKILYLEEEIQPMIRLDLLKTRLRAITNPGAASQICHNAGFSIRQKTGQDGTNSHCHGEQCIDITCGVNNNNSNKK